MFSLSTINSVTLNNKKTRVTINPTMSAPYNLQYRVPSIHNTIATSTLGQYVSFCASGCIYSSSDYGATFSLNSFNLVFSSIAINSSGQYQVCSTYGIPSVAICMSSNYGATWTIRRNVGYHDARYIEQCAISPSGQYVFACGGGQAGSRNFSSNDYGVNWTEFGGILLRSFCCMNDDKVFFYCDYDQGIYSVLLSATTVTESYFRVGNFGGNTQKIYCNSFSSFFVTVHRDQNQMAVSTDSGVTFQNRTTPVLHKFQIVGSIFYGASNTAIYKSTDYGVTWTIIFTVPAGKTIRSMTANNTYIFMVYLSGEVVVYKLTGGKV